jgi:hypothetical protein
MKKEIFPGKQLGKLKSRVVLSALEIFHNMDPRYVNKIIVRWSFRKKLKFRWFELTFLFHKHSREKMHFVVLLIPPWNKQGRWYLLVEEY